MKAAATSSNPLPVVAREIVFRLDKADKLKGEINDHRIAAALLVVEAKARVDAGEAGNMPTGKPYTWPRWRAAEPYRSIPPIP